MMTDCHCQVFAPVLLFYPETVDAIKRVFQWLINMVNICNKNMGRPYRKCKDAFDDGYQKCR